MRHKEKKNIKENGITLIALIITIIVLVILTAITIQAVFETNIIGYAVNGATDYLEESKRENQIIINTQSLISSAEDRITTPI